MWHQTFIRVEVHVTVMTGNSRIQNHNTRSYYIILIRNYTIVAELPLAILKSS
jgi:hypothetical protein